MQEELDNPFVAVAIEVVDPISVEQRGSPLDAMDFIAFVPQEFGGVGTILASHSSDKSFLQHVTPQIFIGFTLDQFAMAFTIAFASRPTSPSTC